MEVRTHSSEHNPLEAVVRLPTVQLGSPNHEKLSEQGTSWIRWSGDGEPSLCSNS